MSAKAANYIEQLDKARCDGNWGSVPELVRKVRKHAPERACLTLAAETEHAITNATTNTGATTTAAKSTSSNRPATAHQGTNNLDVSGAMPKLLEAIDKEEHHVEDRFQAQVCVGWLHWVVAEHSLALQRLPKSLDYQDTQVDPADARSEWTTVCALKAAYLRANCLSRIQQRKEALRAFQAGLPSLARVWSGRPIRKQLSYWAELFLTEYCMLTSQAIEDKDAPLDDHNSVACFRSWAKYWDVTSASASGGSGFRGAVPRRRVWKEYYITLSRILEEDLPFPTGYLSKIANDGSARSKLRVELKGVETTYQTLLLKETSFPRADEERAEVEAFVKLVVRNWSILSGRGWREQDLGPGGRISLSRGVLDTLYSAATKTFHSTAILRSLFLVHVSVGEFDLAFKSFDSYLDIIKKGKARVDKTGEAEPSLDDDGTVLQTMAQAVIALCHYGPEHLAERARQLGAELEDWLARLPQLRAGENGRGAIAEHEATEDLHPPISPQIVALSWQAIGLSHAHWSRATHEAASRTEIQSRAIRCLRRSLAAELGRAKDIRSYFTLGLLLAERRELTAAIEVVKAALSSNKGYEGQYHLRFGPYWLERSLIPMWHLLALLLSARQDYVMAARACEGALEQFRDPSVLFGKQTSESQSEHTNGDLDEKPAGGSPKGLIDEMSDSEKEAILEVKMTQLALVELLEGPEVAVNACYELLALFSRLFGNLGVTAAPTFSPPKFSERPKTSGTLRSVKGSILRGRDKSRPPSRQPSNAVLTEGTSGTPTRPGTSRTTASATPTIQVTGDGLEQQSRRGSTGHSRRSDSRQRHSLRRSERSVSRHRVPSVTGLPRTDSGMDGETFYTPPPAAEAEQPDFLNLSNRGRAPSLSRGGTLTSLNSYLVPGSKPGDYSELSADWMHASVDILPVVQFSKDKERLQKTTILIRVWLMVAGFYRRANMVDDCQAAVTEAQKLVQALEADSSREHSASVNGRNVGWAERKSVEGLWGDVYTELGLASLAKDSPYTARSEFESALLYIPDHPEATVGLSKILLDIYCEELRPTPPVPPLDGPNPYPGEQTVHSRDDEALKKKKFRALPSSTLGLGPSIAGPEPASTLTNGDETPVEPKAATPHDRNDDLPEPYKATRLPLVDRLAARDRAYALLTGLTRLGSGWNHSDAWFTLARAYEESGQPDKAKDVLWWCVELEEARGVREWKCLGSGGYVL